ncbi:MAG: hypothetical protein CM1200mP26_03670 [Acidimicrobiales bacterium]|nr:MAG: hypothetical protein CM1200mP26_03670 [Acidimicrobiales bacterium]
MAMAALGETIDLHGGGNDLTFPHHECEAAQSEAANGQPFARHWFACRNGCLRGHQDAQKSLGNLVFVRNLRHMHDPRAIRLALMAHHYRGGFEWFDYDIDEGHHPPGPPCHRGTALQRTEPGADPGRRAGRARR